MDEKKTHNDVLHEEMVKQGGSKRRALQRVRECFLRTSKGNVSLLGGSGKEEDCV